MTDVEFGGPPSAEDERWAEVARSLPPAKSIERLEGALDRLFGIVGLTSLGLTGLGLATSNAYVGSPVIPTVSAIAVGLSLVAATLALLALYRRPRALSGHHLEIKRYVERRLKWRGWVAVAAHTLVTGALVLLIGTLVTVAARPPEPEPMISIMVDNSGEAVTGAVSVSADGLATDTSVEVELLVRREGAADPAVIAASLSRAGSTGDVAVEHAGFDLGGIVSLEAVVTVDGRVHRESLELPQ